eukprot:Transcript_24309.p1 GENE.Transcript_24309~~Transcript_24309.p1  ORF type:complete len:402 (-),score=133.37 Transcript_24309:29-1234(-)
MTTAALEFTTLPGRNRSVLAARPIAAGELLLSERPIASMQLPDNQKALRTCGTCLRACGTISRQLQHATQCSTTPQLPFASAEDDLICHEVACRNKCGVIFCSASCKEAGAGAHAYLCATGRRQRALQRFEAHALAEGENFLFGARLVAEVLARADALHCASGQPRAACTTKARKVLAPFCRGVWWEISDPPDDLSPLEAASYQREVKEAAAESLRLLRALLGASAPPPDLGWLTLAEWGGILGLARQNNICCELDNPVGEVLPMLHTHAAAAAAVSGKAGAEGRALAAVLGGLPQPMPECVMGTALFDRLACINHSCAPNAEVWPSRDGSHEARLVARRAIAAGDEVTISYIDANQRAGVRERRRELCEYGFVCACAKCEAEAGWQRRLRPRVARVGEGI